MSRASRFCNKCGTALPADSSFCPTCGAAVTANAASQATSTPTPQPGPATTGWEGRRYERREKQEKREKNEKNEKHEKSRGGDLAGALTGGLVLILLGLLLYLAESNIIAVSWSNWWVYFLIGIGVILVIQGMIRYGQHGYVSTGSFIGGAVLILIGLAFVSSVGAYFWPLILVVLGIAAIASALAGRRRTPAP